MSNYQHILVHNLSFALILPIIPTANTLSSTTQRATKRHNSHQATSRLVPSSPSWIVMRRWSDAAGPSLWHGFVGGVVAGSHYPQYLLKCLSFNSK